MKEKKTEVVTFRTTPTIKKYLDEEAQRLDRTPAWIADKIITEYVKQKTGQAQSVQFNITHNENINL